MPCDGSMEGEEGNVSSSLLTVWLTFVGEVGCGWGWAIGPICSSLLMFCGWKHVDQSKLYTFYGIAMKCLVTLHFSTIVWDMIDERNDFVTVGESFCMASGIGLVLYKMIYHYFYGAEFEAIFIKLQQYHNENNSRHKSIMDMQRYYFIEECFILVGFCFIGLSLELAFLAHTFLDSTLPIRAKYPFDFSSTYAVTALSIFQMLMCVYVIHGIVFIDGIGGQIMSQMSLQFDIIAKELSGGDYSTRNQDDIVRFNQIIERHQELIRILGEWKHVNQSKLYTIYGFVMRCLIAFHFSSILWDILETRNDFVALGEGLCMVAGVGLVIYKMGYHYVYSVEFEAIFYKLQRYHKENNERNKIAMDIQRYYFLEECIILILTVFCGLSLELAMLGHTFIDGTLPIRAKYPFEFSSVYALTILSTFQMMMCVYIIHGIVFIDGIGGQIMSQMSLQFEIIADDLLRNDFRTENRDSIVRFSTIIDKHQELIALGYQINALYQPLLLAQMACSLSMICLTAFEATLTIGDHLMFMKFFVYCICAFVQIFYWCYYGDRVSFKSTSVHDALIQLDWVGGDQIFKKNYCITLIRGQAPFQFKVYGYFPVSFTTFISIMSKSYSFFTLFQSFEG
ncbi:uncharacterized protein LOC129752866 [Uranotaenia lowii]|uniref:uncharacterized protein LOC129752866 n=1 Tax=Uranotaenia lowii TaxID=190385 RepID=UPI00247A35E1|nr:uncharacterized protein LOC129752866 [Uranotaenia lowii]